MKCPPPARAHAHACALRSLGAALILSFAAPHAAAQDKPAPPAKPTRPPYVFLRQNEDWLRFDPATAEKHAPLDAWKHVKLSEDWWASFGAEATSRVESWNNFAFGPANDDTFILTRVRAHGALHWRRHQLFTELKTAQSTERDLPGGRRTSDLDTFAIQQLFVDAVVPTGEGTLTLRPGRQMLSFGAQRLISPLPWGNTLRTWDGATAIWNQGAWQVTGIAVDFVPVDKTDSNERDRDEGLFGVYARNLQNGPKNGYEAYALYSQRETATFNGTTGSSDRVTLGTRRWLPFAESWDFESELSYQLGEVGDEDVGAWSVASQVGRTFDCAGAPRLWLGLDWASGDDSTGGDVETFDQLYPLGHAFLGYMDYIGRQNIIDTSLGVNWNVQPDIVLGLGNHAFWADSTDDALYNAGGGVLRPAGSFDSSWVGFETDVTATWKPSSWFDVLVGYSHFFAGDAIEESGADEDSDFVYLQVTTRF